MKFSEINPFARYIRYLDIKEHNQISSKVVPLDCRLFYVLKGVGSFEINGQTIILNSGSVLYINSGVAYTHLPCDAIYLAVNFDFTQNHSHLSSPIPPCPAEEKFSLVEKVTFSDCEALNSFLVINDCQQCEEIFKNSEKEFLRRSPFYNKKLGLQITEILITLLRKNEQSTANDSRFDAEKIADYLRKNLTEKIDNKTLAEKFHFHPNYLSSEFAKYFGKPVHRYVLEIRILKAISLLESGNDNIALIAQSVGFENGNYFSRYFKKITGVSPKFYLKKR